MQGPNGNIDSRKVARDRNAATSQLLGSLLTQPARHDFDQFACQLPRRLTGKSSEIRLPDPFGQRIDGQDLPRRIVIIVRQVLDLGMSHLPPPAAEAGTRPGRRRRQVNVLVGASLTPEVVERVPQMAVSVALIPIYIAAIGLIGVPRQHRGGWPPRRAGRRGGSG